MEEDEFEKS